MIRVALVAGIAVWVGAALLLSEFRWFRHRPLVDRLAPYAPAAADRSVRSGLLSVQSFSEVVGPLSRSFGERFARLFGVDEELDIRLRRTHSTDDATSFRVRQVSWAGATLVACGLTASAIQPPAAAAVFLLAGGPVTAFLLLEQKVSKASEAWQRRVFLELPVIAEQLGMLLAAGYSMGAAISRVAIRGEGACAADLRRVVARMRHGLTEVQALHEWADLVDVDAVNRLVAILALNREAGDLGSMISDEARSIRREVQREQLERIERRNQQVWIPVTVATLIPGVILLAVPFVDALSSLSTSP